MEWKTVLAYITGTVDQELLLRNEYLVAENRILRNQITGRVRLTDGERTTLAALGKRLGKQALCDESTSWPKSSNPTTSLPSKNLPRIVKALALIVFSRIYLNTSALLSHLPLPFPIPDTPHQKEWHHQGKGNG